MNTSATSNKFGHQDSQPWYKNYMVVIFVIGLPLFVVVACLWFVYYSFQIQDTVVRDDWYMDGKTLYQDVSRDKLAHDLDIKASMSFDKDDHVTFKLMYPTENLKSGKLTNGTPVYYPDQLSLSVSHATDINRDRDAILVHQKDNIYTANISIDDIPSKYYVQVSNESDLNWRLREVGKLPQSEITFEPLPSFNE